MDEEMRLPDLPTEVLWRIATSGPAESAVAMIAVCRRLRDALHDSLVFKQIIECQQVSRDRS